MTTNKKDEGFVKLLRKAQSGDKEASEALFAEIYPILKRVAKSHIRKLNNQLTINTTSVVHEVYIRFFHDSKEMIAQDRVHFFAMISTAMRWLLLEMIRANKTQKRGANAIHISLDQIGIGANNSLIDILAFDNLLTELGKKNERLLHIVQLRALCGMSIEETAHSLNISPATAKRDWKLASEWLSRKLSNDKKDVA